MCMLKTNWTEWLSNLTQSADVVHTIHKSNYFCIWIQLAEITAHESYSEKDPCRRVLSTNTDVSNLLSGLVILPTAVVDFCFMTWTYNKHIHSLKSFNMLITVHAQTWLNNNLSIIH